MIKENISGWVVMEIMRADPKNTEAYHPSHYGWHDLEWWRTVAIGLLNSNDWSVRTKQTKLDKVMEEIKEKSYNWCGDESGRAITLCSLKPILEKVIV